MKILIAHNDYRAHSGEETVVDRMADELKRRSIEVCQLRRSSSEYAGTFSGKIKGFVEGIYSTDGVKAMRKMLIEEKPDVVNVHNLYPFISPAALRECKKAEVPVVMTVHNYRLICPTGLMMRDGASCELCLTKGNEWPCVYHNCEHSIMKSAGYALRNCAARIRRDYLDCVDRFACLTDFQRKKLIQAGFPEERLCVIPNFASNWDEVPARDGHYIAYSGRLGKEKGIDIVIEAARRMPDKEFRLAGKLCVPEIKDNLPENVKMLGFLSGEKFVEFHLNARLFVMASRCYEGFPMSVLEAAQYAKPTVCPCHGAFPEIIKNPRLLFEPGSVDDLVDKIQSVYDEAPELGSGLRRGFAESYSSEAVMSKWMKLFAELRGSRV